MRILHQTTPLLPWSDISLGSVLKRGVPDSPEQYSEWRRAHQGRFFFEDVFSLQGAIGDGATRAANRILDGDFPFFGRQRGLGFPPPWQMNPLTGQVAPGGHWSSINTFGHGDIKLIWEASRFSWVYALTRAYALSREERHPEAFWKLFMNWLDENPPNWGVNWICGQETAFRAMAICFAAYAFASSSASTPRGTASLTAALSVHANRIAAFTEYARSQKNNHGISEGVGLWTIGLLFPELKGAERWVSMGKMMIENEVRRQIYHDGSYVQHSFNYHRLMLQDLGWAFKLGECNSQRFAPDVYDRFGRAVQFLEDVTDPESGWTPNYGANDGALLLPLSDCEYPDMRPTLQSCHFLAHGKRLYPQGPWDEEMSWLSGIEAKDAPRAQNPRPATALTADVGGYYTLRGNDSWLMFRAVAYKDRPSHADQLHADLWWRGENVLCDAGTYSYNAQPPFDDGFAGSSFHNTVTIDTREQMTRISRFLWADWANARVNRPPNEDADFEALAGEHDGYRECGTMHRRAVAKIGGDTWIFVDDVVGTGQHRFRLHWLLPDVPVNAPEPGFVEAEFRAGTARLTIASSAPTTTDVVRAGVRISGCGEGEPEPARGWLSRYYAHKEPAISIAVEGRSALPVRLVTVVVLGRAMAVTIVPSMREIMLGPRRIELAQIGADPVFAKDRFTNSESLIEEGMRQ